MSKLFLILSVTVSLAWADSRGIENNNPGNIVKEDSIHWQGEVEVNTDGKFEQFTSPFYGIRALLKNLNSYVNVHGLEGTHAIMYRWAPPHDNEHALQYYEYVIGKAGEKGALGYNDYTFNLVKAIIYFENGKHPYTDDFIRYVMSKVYF